MYTDRFQQVFFFFFVFPKLRPCTTCKGSPYIKWKPMQLLCDSSKCRSIPAFKHASRLGLYIGGGRRPAAIARVNHLDELRGLRQGGNPGERWAHSICQSWPHNTLRMYPIFYAFLHLHSRVFWIPPGVAMWASPGALINSTKGKDERAPIAGQQWLIYSDAHPSRDRHPSY